MKKFLACILALLMVLGVSTTALAAEPQTASEIERAVRDAAPGSTVDIELRNDIADPIYLGIPDDVTVKIHGDYVLAGVDCYGKGTIDLKVKAIESQDSYGLYVEGKLDITIEADYIKGDDRTASYDEGESYYYGTASDGVYIREANKVVITADIYGGDGILPEGGLDLPGSYADGGSGLYIDIDASETDITVNGNIIGGASLGDYGYGADALVIEAEDDASVTVTVNGDVIGGKVTANPQLDGEYSWGGDGMYLYTWETSEITVEVNGDVTGGDTNGYNGDGGNGINADEGGRNATVKVTGNVTGGSATGEGETRGGIGIGMPLGDVTVIGDVTGGNGLAGGHGVVAFITDTEDEVGRIYVDGTIAPGKGEEAQAIRYYDNAGVPPIGEIYGNTMFPYEFMKINGLTDEEILSEIAIKLQEGQEYGLLSDEDGAAYFTKLVKLLAAELGVEIPAGYEVTVERGEVQEDEIILAITDALGEIEKAEKDELYAAIAPVMADAYNAIVEEAVYTLANLGVYGTRITAWRLIPGELGGDVDISFDALLEEYGSASDMVDMLMGSMEMCYRNGLIRDAEYEAIVNEVVSEGVKAIGLELPADAKMIVVAGMSIPNEAMQEFVEESGVLDDEDASMAMAKVLYKHVLVLSEKLMQLPATCDMNTMEIYLLFAQTVDYIIRVEDAANGTVTTDVKTVFEDEIVTVTATPNSDYKLSGLNVYGEALEGDSFAGRINGGIVVKASFTPIDNPPTGDGGAVWFTVLAMTAMAGVALLVIKRKKA